MVNLGGNIVSIELTDEQSELVNLAFNWFNKSSEQVLEFSGAGGTGKSFVCKAIIDRLGLDPSTEVAAMAFSGAAALVLRRNGFSQAKTIHSSIYTYQYEYNPITNKTTRGFIFTGLPDRVKLVIVDEASMVPMNIKEDLLRCGKKVIACGDLDQLPPVVGEPAFLNDPSKVFRLTKIMRQAEGSAIVQISHMVKNGRTPQPGYYGAVNVVERNELFRMLREFVSEYGILIVGTNKTRDSLNERIRKEIYGYESPLPVKGDKLICRKNNWEIEIDGINLVNGLCGISMSTPSISAFAEDSFLIDFKPEFMTEYFKALDVDYKYFVADHATRMQMKNINNICPHEKFEYAYAITTHVSQGSQFDTGIYMQEYFPSHSNNPNYTGISRFRERALYVIPNQKKYWKGSSFHSHRRYYQDCRILTKIPVPKLDGTI
jgi:ATP-dependent exoDNAse (exonuclease V) alpha subunit